MRNVADVTGVVLAGGRSLRFGTDKPFATFRGEPMVAGVLQVMRQVFSKVLIATNTSAGFRSLGVEIVRDLEPYQGPLGAIVSVFSHICDEQIFVVGCDMPLINAGVIRQILAGRNSDTDAVIPIHEGVREYLMALYSRSLLEAMRQCLYAGRLSLRDFFRELPRVHWIPVSGDAFFNVNTKQDLEFLERHHAY